MFFDHPSKNTAASPADDIAADTGARTTLYKLGLNSGEMNQLAASYKDNKTDSSEFHPAGTADIHSTAQAEPSVLVRSETTQETAEPELEITRAQTEPENTQERLVQIPPEEPAVSPEVEEPIPSLFEGIGRTSWNNASEQDDSPILYFFDEPDDYNYPYDEEHEDISSAAESAAEEISEEESDDEVDVFELLDFIDDIEFSGMEPEPLRAVQYAAESGDPYNTAFNDPEADAAEPDEFSVAPAYEFEKK